MLKNLSRYVGKFEERKWIIGLIAVLIAIAAATISVLVFLERRQDEEEQSYIEEDCFAE